MKAEDIIAQVYGTPNWVEAEPPQMRAGPLQGQSVQTQPTPPPRHQWVTQRDPGATYEVPNDAPEPMWTRSAEAPDYYERWQAAQPGPDTVPGNQTPARPPEVPYGLRVGASAKETDAGKVNFLRSRLGDDNVWVSEKGKLWVRPDGKSWAPFKDSMLPDIIKTGAVLGATMLLSPAAAASPVIAGLMGGLTEAAGQGVSAALPGSDEMTPGERALDIGLGTAAGYGGQLGANSLARLYYGVRPRNILGKKVLSEVTEPAKDSWWRTLVGGDLEPNMGPMRPEAREGLAMSQESPLTVGQATGSPFAQNLEGWLDRTPANNPLKTFLGGQEENLARAWDDELRGMSNRPMGVASAGHKVKDALVAEQALEDEARYGLSRYAEKTAAKAAQEVTGAKHPQAYGRALKERRGVLGGIMRQITETRERLGVQQPMVAPFGGREFDLDPDTVHAVLGTTWREHVHDVLAQPKGEIALEQWDGTWATLRARGGDEVRLTAGKGGNLYTNETMSVQDAARRVSALIDQKYYPTRLPADVFGSVMDKAVLLSLARQAGVKTSKGGTVRTAPQRIADGALKVLGNGSRALQWEAGTLNKRLPAELQLDAGYVERALGGMTTPAMTPQMTGVVAAPPSHWELDGLMSRVFARRREKDIQSPIGMGPIAGSSDVRDLLGGQWQNHVAAELNKGGSVRLENHDRWLKLEGDGAGGVEVTSGLSGVTHDDLLRNAVKPHAVQRMSVEEAAAQAMNEAGRGYFPESLPEDVFRGVMLRAASAAADDTPKGATARAVLTRGGKAMQWAGGGPIGGDIDRVIQRSIERASSRPMVGDTELGEFGSRALNAGEEHARQAARRRSNDARYNYGQWVNAMGKTPVPADMLAQALATSRQQFRQEHVAAIESLLPDRLRSQLGMGVAPTMSAGEITATLAKLNEEIAGKGSFLADLPPKARMAVAKKLKTAIDDDLGIFEVSEGAPSDAVNLLRRARREYGAASEVIKEAKGQPYRDAINSRSKGIAVAPEAAIDALVKPGASPTRTARQLAVIDRVDPDLGRDVRNLAMRRALEPIMRMTSDGPTIDMQMLRKLTPDARRNMRALVGNDPEAGPALSRLFEAAVTWGDEAKILSRALPADIDILARRFSGTTGAKLVQSVSGLPPSDIDVVMKALRNHAPEDADTVARTIITDMATRTGVADAAAEGTGRLPSRLSMLGRAENRARLMVLVPPQARPAVNELLNRAGKIATAKRYQGSPTEPLQRMTLLVRSLWDAARQGDIPAMASSWLQARTPEQLGVLMTHTEGPKSILTLLAPSKSQVATIHAAERLMAILAQDDKVDPKLGEKRNATESQEP